MAYRSSGEERWGVVSLSHRGTAGLMPHRDTSGRGVGIKIIVRMILDHYSLAPSTGRALRGILRLGQTSP
jgi:hypothetical protein